MKLSTAYTAFGWGILGLGIYVSATQGQEDVRAACMGVMAFVAFATSDILKAISKLAEQSAPPSSEPLSSFASKSSENAARSVG